MFRSAADFIIQRFVTKATSQFYDNSVTKEGMGSKQDRRRSSTEIRYKRFSGGVRACAFGPFVVQQWSQKVTA